MLNSIFLLFFLCKRLLLYSWLPVWLFVNSTVIWLTQTIIYWATLKSLPLLWIFKKNLILRDQTKLGPNTPMRKKNTGPMVIFPHLNAGHQGPLWSQACRHDTLVSIWWLHLYPWGSPRLSSKRWHGAPLLMSSPLQCKTGSGQRCSSNPWFILCADAGRCRYSWIHKKHWVQ